MSRTFKDAEELHTYLTNNPSHKIQILATISDELKKDYKRFQTKLRQQRYREAHKDIANERSRLKMAANRAKNPEKYKKMNAEHNKKYKNKSKAEFEKAIDQIVTEITKTLNKPKSK